MIAGALLLGLVAAAHASPDGPYLWVRGQAGGGGWPSGAIADIRAQVRTPLYHSDAFLLQDTYAGAGLRLAATPAFVEGGPRLSIAPAAFFDMDVQASVHRYFSGSFGLLPYDAPEHKLESDRTPRADEVVPSTAWTLSANPTLKGKLGPIVAFDSFLVEAWHIEQPSGVSEPYVYEPFRDMVVAWDDVVLEHQPALLWAAWTGDGTDKKLWLGPTMRDRFALVSGDRSLTLGGTVILRPGSPSPAVPQLILQVLPYLIDADRVGGVPNIQGVLVWKGESPLKAAAAPR